MQETVITRTLVPEEQRLAFIEKRFGVAFPLHIEPVIYTFANRLAASYVGGYWLFYTVDLGFYMAPEADDLFEVVSPNGFEGKLSGDGLGLTACLLTFSNLSFHDNKALAVNCARHYHLLREYVMAHPEAGKILAAVD